MEQKKLSKESLLQLIQESYGHIFEPELITKISELGSYRIVRSGEILIDLGEQIKSMPLLLKGAVKIIREDKDGHELFLYYIERGDTCAFSLACCMGATKSEIRAMVEEDAEIILIPVE